MLRPHTWQIFLKSLRANYTVSKYPFYPSSPLDGSLWPLYMFAVDFLPLLFLSRNSLHSSRDSYLTIYQAIESNQNN